MGNGFFPGGYGPTNQWPVDFFPDAPSGSQPLPPGIEHVVFTVIGIFQARLVSLALNQPRFKSVRIIS